MKNMTCTTCGASPCRCRAARQLVNGRPGEMLRLLGFKDPNEVKAKSGFQIGGVRRGARRS